MSIFVSTNKRPHTSTTMNDNINMDNTCTTTVSVTICIFDLYESVVNIYKL